MAYNIALTDGTLLAIIPNNTVLPSGSALDLTLYGKGKLDYGEQWNTNFVHLAENFSSATPPSAPLKGQIWYDKVNENVNYYDGTSWFVLLSSGAAAGIFVNVTGDTMSGDLKFEIQSLGDSPGLRFPATGGGTDEARVYVEQLAGFDSNLVIQIADDPTDRISFRQHIFGEVFAAEIMRLSRPVVGKPGVMEMMFDAGAGTPGLGTATMAFNEGGGDVTAGSDLRVHSSCVLSAGQSMYFHIEDGVTTTVPGEGEFHFNIGSDKIDGSQTSLALIDNNGGFFCARDVPATGGTADWFLSGRNAATAIDFGSFNNNIRSLRAVRRNGLDPGVPVDVFIRIEGAAAVNNQDFTTLQQVNNKIAALPTVDSFNSSEFNTNVNTLRTWAHGLGGVPTAVGLYAINRTGGTVGGLPNGGRVQLNPTTQDDDEVSSPVGTSMNCLAMTSTTIYVRNTPAQGTTGWRVSLPNGTFINLNNSTGGWTIQVRAIRIS